MNFSWARWRAKTSGMPELEPAAFAGQISMVRAGFHLPRPFPGLGFPLALAALCLAALECGGAEGRSEAVGWGDDQFGQATVPLSASNDIVQVAAGASHSVVLRSNGTVAIWGKVWNGTHYDPVTLPAGLTNVVAISAGFFHTIALKSDGTVTGWGYDKYGAASGGAGLTNIVSISANADQSLAMQEGGKVFAWGRGTAGSTSIPGWLGNVSAISAGQVHNLALRPDGTVVGWGANYYGQATGVPTLTTSANPYGSATGIVTIAGVTLSNVVAVAAGGNHSLALKPDGTVVGWGKIGDGFEIKPVAAFMPPGLTNVAVLSAGFDHDLAILSNGTMVAWGKNLNGETDAPRWLGRVSAVSAGYEHSLAVQTPSVEVTPSSQVAETDSTASFLVTATGVPTLFYEVMFDGINQFARGTEPLFSITNVQPFLAGTYTLILSNRFGIGPVASTVLGVIPRVPRRTVPALHLAGDAGQIVQIKYADTPGQAASWQALGDVTLTSSPLVYCDLSVSDPLPPQRFYRAFQTDDPSHAPVLGMSLATQIPLAGTVGNKLRVDYINQVGPTNAWVTLDTVTLTNSSQSFFDFGMFGNAARLYRLVPAP